MNARLVIPLAVIFAFVAVVLVAFLAAEGFSAAVGIVVVVLASMSMSAMTPLVMPTTRTPVGSSK